MCGSGSFQISLNRTLHGPCRSAGLVLSTVPGRAMLPPPPRDAAAVCGSPRQDPARVSVRDRAPWAPLHPAPTASGAGAGTELPWHVPQPGAGSHRASTRRASGGRSRTAPGACWNPRCGIRAWPAAGAVPRASRGVRASPATRPRVSRALRALVGGLRL